MIGIDGGTPSLIDGWRSDLPNICHLMEHGVWGRLESTLPPTTVPAWNSMFTGKNPGKHGVFGFYKLPFYGRGGLGISDLSHQDSPSLWDILGRHGKRVGVVNIPTTFPAAKVNGFMVSGGLMTPLSKGVGCAYPPGLLRELDRVCNGYELKPPAALDVPGKEQQYLAQFTGNVDNHVKALKYLMEQFEWNFMAYSFFVTDSIQHYSWHLLDPEHPYYDRERADKYGDAIKKVYQKVDAAIGELRAVLPPETNILIVSDHGGGPCYREFLINEWLRRQGLLTLKRSHLRARGRLVSACAPLRDVALKLLPHAAVEFVLRRGPKQWLRRFLRVQREADDAADLLECIDWAKTQAYALGSPPQIFVNLKGREPAGTVEPRDYEKVRDEICLLLSQVKDPDSGRPVRCEVIRREEAYRGPHLSEAPDLLLVMDDFKCLQRAGLGRSVWSAPTVKGWHSRHGIFVACGPDMTVAGGRIPDVSILDITPTVLHLMGLALPADVDGRVIREALAGDSVPGRETERYEESQERRRIEEAVRRLRRSNRV